MTNADLIADLSASNPHLRQADVELIVQTIFDDIASALARGQRAELRGFGAFTLRRRSARVGRNPRTGAEVPVDERTRPFFRVRRMLHERLNHSRSGMTRCNANGGPTAPTVVDRGGDDG
jgi:integration host factor subunit beta